MEPKGSSRLYPVCGKDLNSSNSYHTNKWPEVPTYRNVVKMTGCLEIIDGEDSGIFDNQDNSRPSSSSSLRSWSRGSVRYAPGRVDSSQCRFVNTPTKQVALQAVPRKEDSFRLESNVDTSQCETRPSLPKHEKAEMEKKPLHLKLKSNSHNIQEQKSEVGDKDRDRDEKDGEDNNDDDEDNDDDSDSSDEEEEKRRAPNELLMEFVDSLMRKDFPTASKLCKMILLYEPDNKEALKFQPLIEEKIILDAEAEDESTDEEDGEGTDDNDDSDDEEEEDDSSDEEDSSSDDDASNDEDEDDDDGDGCHAGGGSHACANQNNPRPSHIPRPCHQRH